MDLSRLREGHKKWPVNAKAPQKQCKYYSDHIAHHFTHKGGLIWWCQGRGQRS